MKKIIATLLLIALISMSIVPIFAEDSDFPEELILSNKLKNLGLFLGESPTSFGLDREMKRVEGIVMLIRLLGKESQVKDLAADHPFKDVPSWADGYVTYAFKNGLTNGISSDQFGSHNSLSPEMYTTFLLRSLKYDDRQADDFKWNTPFDLAEKTGVITSRVDRIKLLRKDAVNLTVGALFANEKASKNRLVDSLIAQRSVKENIFDFEFPKDPLFSIRAADSGVELYTNKDFTEAKQKAENGYTNIKQRIETPELFIINGELTGVMHGPVGYLKVAFNKNTNAGEGTLIQLPLPQRFASGGAIAPENLELDKEKNILTYSFKFEEDLWFDKGGESQKLIREKGTHKYTAYLNTGLVTHKVVK